MDTGTIAIFMVWYNSYIYGVSLDFMYVFNNW